MRETRAIGWRRGRPRLHDYVLTGCQRLGAVSGLSVTLCDGRLTNSCLAVSVVLVQMFRVQPHDRGLLIVLILVER